MDGDEGMEAVWIERSRRNAPEAAKVEATFLRDLDSHRKKIGPCERCDWWMAQGLSPFCPPHEPK